VLRLGAVPPPRFISDLTGNRWDTAGTFTAAPVSTVGPTAATASISGRVIAPETLGLINAIVTLTDANGNTRTVNTVKAGRYTFTDVAVGETYILSVTSKRYRYAPQIITVTEDVTELNFSPQ
jgi:bifunctional N-acetylglucosamine-1-phosphate-uridyltransferase/glucosamine-1-phosphate-acetyltransferase GlmU-like protein